MKQEHVRNIFSQVDALLRGSKLDDLEKIEHLLEGTISKVEPRNDFRKGLGQRLVNQHEDSPVEIERIRGSIKRDTDYSPISPEISMLVTGLIGGIALIFVGVRILLYFRERGQISRS